jgi:exodeoxyribonuclease VII small subunit
MTYEEAEKELLQIVERLERGDAGLDEALRLWERGEELYRFCAEQLDAAEGKIEELGRRVDAAGLDG